METKRFISIILRLAPLFVIFTTWLTLVLINFNSNRWLSGWDNLHPEFNFSLNIYRSLSAAWQEYQGIGLLGGMGHAADLPRQLVLLVLSLIIPVENLRYVWTFLMLLIGPLGVYYLTQKLISFGNKRIGLGPLVGSMFYLLNFATLQYFFTPFETFVSFYGLFPWLLFFSIAYLKSGERVDLVKFAVFSFFATPAFYVQTLFIVYGIVLAIFCLNTVVIERQNALKKIAGLVVAILAANAYWLLPVMVFAVTSSTTVDIAKINTIATPETQLMNESSGGMLDVALLKGFWFDYTDYFSGEGKFDFLLKDWKSHVGQFAVRTIGVSLFVASILGIFLNLSKRGGRTFGFSIVAVFVTSILMLTSTNPPFGGAFQVLSNAVPLFGQVFRSVFTKWSIVLALFSGVGLGALVSYMADNGKLIRGVSWFVAGLIILGSLVVMKPTFEGKLISADLSVNFPSEYHNLFEFFGSQPKQARIAFFPVHSFWGWNFYDWGYRGSGFLWYGIEQPILDRAFDVWSGYNETFYHEAVNALAREEANSLEKVLAKYDVSFVLVDESIYVPLQEKSLLKNGQLKAMLEKEGAILVWQEGKLSVYDVRPLTGSVTWLYSPEKYYQVAQDSKYSRRDEVYQRLGTYIEKPGVEYPFSDLHREEVEGVEYTTDGLAKVSLLREVENAKPGSKLVVPGFPKGSTYITKARTSFTGNSLIVEFDSLVSVDLGSQTWDIRDLPQIEIAVPNTGNAVWVSLGESNFEVKREVVSENLVKLTVGEPVNLVVFDGPGRQINISDDFLNFELATCWTRESARGKTSSAVSGGVLLISSRDAFGCKSFQLGELGGSKSLLSVAQAYKSNSGARPHFCVLPEGEQVNCENDEVFYSSYPSVEWASVERKMVLPGNVNYWLIVGGRPPDEAGQEWTIDYRPPQVRVHKMLAEKSISAEIWKTVITDKQLVLSSEANQIKLSFYSDATEVDFYRGGRQQIKNCDLFNRGEVAKARQFSGVSYQTNNWGVACDYVALVRLSPAKNYLVRLTGETILGRPMKFYLYNNGTKRNDLEAIVDGGNFDKTFSLLSWPHPESYTLNLETRSFGRPTNNFLSSAVFYESPLDWLSRWRLGDEVSQLSSVSVRNLQKIGTYMYRADIDGRGLFVLSQGFDAGWIGLTGQGRVLEHVKVNSWANGWLVDASESQTVYIFFWPQALEFGGFAVLLVTLMVLAWPRRRPS